MLTVWKYEVDLLDEITIHAPKGATFLSCATQRGIACLWALVDPSAPDVPYRFRIAGTGHPLLPKDIAPFLGTVFLYDGGLVFHVFGPVTEGA